MSHAQAILWAQWRTLRNFYPRGGTGWAVAVAVIWYGIWTAAALALAKLFSSTSNLALVRTVLPGGLLLVFLYWQVVPLLMAATGASLELRKLQVYPIPAGQLFSIEVLLRTTGAIEMLLIIVGVACGVFLNSSLGWRAALGLMPYILFNLFLAVGLRDLLVRILARKRIREIAFLLLVICAALPQLLLLRGAGIHGRLRLLTMKDAWAGWPWTATANLILSHSLPLSSAVLAAWTLAAALFGWWQFSLTMSFDADAANATDSRPATRQGFADAFFRLPWLLFSDPLAALIEKELRVLVRSPRFRLVFLMGFTFGLVVWLPLAMGRGSAAMPLLGSHYLTVVSVYSLLLLSEVCFWNSFGFDRSAAQIYFLAPVPFSRVVISKNLSALFFIALEISAVISVCALLGMALNPLRLAEAYSVAGVISIFLLGAGNLMSIHQARAVNPASSFRKSAAGRAQAMLFVIYPIAFIPAGLAYLAQYAFGTQSSFFTVLGINAVIGMVMYRVALDSTVAAAERLKERMVAALSSGEGPIAT
jgi:ABC-2 type transport system permease protein